MRKFFSVKLIPSLFGFLFNTGWHRVCALLRSKELKLTRAFLVGSFMLVKNKKSSVHRMFDTSSVHRMFDTSSQSGSKHAAHAAKALRWRVKQILKSKMPYKVMESLVVILCFMFRSTLIQHSPHEMFYWLIVHMVVSCGMRLTSW